MSSSHHSEIVRVQDRDLALASPTSAASPARRYLASLAEGPSRATMTVALRVAVGVWRGLDEPSGCDERFALDLFPWREVDADLVEGLRNALRARYAVGHANKVMSAVRQVLKRCLRHETDHAHATKLMAASQVSNDKRKRESPGKMLTDAQLRALFASAAAQPPPWSARTMFVLGLLLQTGVRRAEAASLAIDDVLRDHESGPSIKVIGKGDKQRLVPMTDAFARALDRWLSVRGQEFGPLVCQITRLGTVLPREAVSSSTIYSIVVAVVRNAGLTKIDADGIDRTIVRPHDFRHTLISSLLDAGVDISTAGKIAGHSRPDTTQNYDHRPERARVAAMKKLNLPEGQ